MTPTQLAEKLDGLGFGIAVILAAAFAWWTNQNVGPKF